MQSTVQWKPTDTGCGNVASIHYNDRVTEAAQLMCQKKVGRLVAVNREGTMVGIISERDILAWISGVGPSTFSARVGEIMTEDVVSVRPETPLSEVWALMADKSIRHVPVVQDGKAVGMISSRDLLKADCDA